MNCDSTEVNKKNMIANVIYYPQLYFLIFK